MPHLLANDYTGTKKTLTKGQMRTLLLSVTQTAGDNSQPPTVVLQDIAAEPAKSSPEGPVSPDAQLDTDSNGKLQCPEAEPPRDPTKTVNATAESPASASGETQEDFHWPKRERPPPLTFTYSQMGVPEYQCLHPVAHSAQNPMVIPDKALASWLVATSGPCVKQYLRAMSPLQFQYPVPQPVWVPWWAVNESASRQTCATSD